MGLIFYSSRYSFIPIFVQVFQLWQNCFVGVRVDEDGFRCDYQMIHLGKIPRKMHYFSGMSLFSFKDYFCILIFVAKIIVFFH